MIKRLFHGKINGITTAALLIAASSLISRFLGIFRDRILAGQFGAGDTLDIYYAAFRIPDLIFNLLILGALSAGFIPIFTSLIKNREDGIEKEKNKEAWQVV
ncbi:MAG: lipid II flippase MurJ, partial [bacterium]|nr:lipid II flippase MurJ [bacterium]